MTRFIRLIFAIILGICPMLAMENTEANRLAAADRYLTIAMESSTLKEMIKAFVDADPRSKQLGSGDDVMKHLNLPLLKKLMKKALVRNYTADEINALADFYASPSMQSALKKSPAFIKDFMALVQSNESTLITNDAITSEANESGSTSSRSAHGKVIRIATQSPLSGAQSVVGQDIKNGALLAVKQLSGPLKKLGYSVELAPFDDQANPDTGVANAKAITADPSILAVIGHYNSGVQIPSSEEYHDAHLCNISPANTNPRVTTRGYLEVNRLCGRDDMQGVAAAQFAQSKGIKRVYVFHDRTNYGQGVAECFKRECEVEGVKVLGILGTEEKADFNSILTRVMPARPDCLFFGGMFDQSAVLFKQARAKAFKGLCLSDDGFDSADAAKIAGASLLQGVGTYFTTVSGPAEIYPDTTKFIADFKDTFGFHPQPFAAQAYDCTAIALKAIETSIKESHGEWPHRIDVCKAVRRIQSFGGITGSITFNNMGDLVKAKYFAIQVTSADPTRWAQSRIDATLDIAPPAGPDEEVADTGDNEDEPVAYQEDDSDVFRLGVVAPLTGEAAVFGLATQKGAQLAVKEWNAKGGVLGKQIKLVVGDDKGDPAEGATVFSDLIRRKGVSAIIGPVMSKVGLAGAPICQVNEIPMLSSTATNPKVTQVGNFIFRACFIDPFQGTVGARFTFNNLKITKAACLFDVGNDYTKGLSEKFKEEFTRLGGQVVGFEGHATGTTDFREQLRRILRDHPGLLYVSDYYNDAALVAKQARSLGFKGPILGGDGWDSPKLAEIGGQAVENTYFTNHFVLDDTRPSVQSFVSNYEAAFNFEEPDALSVLAYDAANIMLSAVKRANSAHGPAIRDTLQATRINTVCGPLTFDQNRNPIKAAVIVQIKNGKQVYFATINP